MTPWRIKNFKKYQLLNNMMYCTSYLSLNIKISNCNAVFGLFLNFVEAYEKECNAQM